MLTQMPVLMQPESAKHRNCSETPSRQIGIVFPLLRLAALRQSGLSLRVQPGPATACGGRNSLGEATSAGAVNSQSCLHAESDRR